MFRGKLCILCVAVKETNHFQQSLRRVSSDRVCFDASTANMEDQATALTVDDLHTSHVDRTLKELQRMIKEHELALDKVCFRNPPLHHKSFTNRLVAADQPTPFVSRSLSVG